MSRAEQIRHKLEQVSSAKSNRANWENRT